MKSIALLALAGLLAGCSVNNYYESVETTAAAETQSERRAMDGVAIEERIPTDVRRLTVIVRSMNRSLAFYRDVLGLKVNYDTEVTLSGVNLPVGEPGTRARLVLLNANDPYIGWVGLMELFDPPLPDAEEPYPRRLGPGGAVLVVNTDDAEARCAAAVAVEGVTMTGPTRLQTYAGRNGGPDIRVMGCNVFDPDGIAVEINQLLD
ncbi:VOC family protein [Altererythrobacter arenosus]|uniref:VOC family protein n=1 Tax=Altererythrobacter arenosus TaxID=3032592 RepID=A0ABY8FMU5_9SPHN|nr:VOC family protein [Altererythrobacter sp. CAU 1644]WFL76347.1 VOC family protein [Altererythrobacter sp. CAU 1644]